MLGTPTESTQRTVTYVPGTFSSLFSFYDGGARQVGSFLNANDADVVAFVYKDGVFPGEDVEMGGVNLFRIGEANQAEFTAAAGEQLAEFERGMRIDPYLGDMERNGIGHSWGLSDVTAAEVAGVHYDKVASLSGAWMPPEWTKSSATEYMDFSYRDILQDAQAAGLVGGGNNPRSHPAFEHGDYYVGPSDDVFEHGVDELVFPTHGAWERTEEMNVLMANHDLIAKDVPANQLALVDLDEWLRG